VLALVGCEGGRDSNLVGRWRDSSVTIEFFRNGTGEVTERGETESFTWSTDNGRLTIVFYDEEWTDDYSLSADGNTLTLFDEWGNEDTFTRLGSD